MFMIQIPKFMKGLFQLITFDDVLHICQRNANGDYICHSYHSVYA